MIQQIYDPASPNFRHYLTPEQFTEQFGPTEQDYQSVIDFAKTNGLTVKATYPNRTLLDVSGSAADGRKSFSRGVARVSTSDGEPFVFCAGRRAVR